MEGNPIQFLRIINFILLEYSQEMANLILENGFDLYAKKDARFIEKVFQLWLNLFKYKPKITIEQFFSVGFGDQKVIMWLEIIENVKKIIKHKNSKTKIQAKPPNDSAMTMRSSSLRPRKLDLKEETPKNISIPMKMDTHSQNNLYPNSFSNINNELQPRNNFNHPVAFKPPVYEKGGIKPTHQIDGMYPSLINENVNPNVFISDVKQYNFPEKQGEFIHKHNDLNLETINTYEEPHSALNIDHREMSNFAKGHTIEYPNNIPQHFDTKQMLKEKNRRQSKIATSKSKHYVVDTHNEINLSQNPPAPHPNIYNFMPEPEEMEYRINDASAHPVLSPTSLWVLQTPQTVSIEEFNKLAKQVKEMTLMISNLTQTVQMLATEIKRKSSDTQCQSWKQSK